MIGINVANKVIDKMLYKGIESLNEILQTSWSDPLNQIPENKERKKEKIHRYSEEMKEEVEEQKLEVPLQPKLIKQTKSYQPTDRL